MIDQAVNEFLAELWQQFMFFKGSSSKIQHFLIILNKKVVLESDLLWIESGILCNIFKSDLLSVGHPAGFFIPK